MKINRVAKRTLKLEQLENRELLSATTWENAAQADAAVAAEMASTLAETTIDLSTLVTTNQDVVDANDGLTSLREAIAAAEAGATITFADGVANIVLSGTQLEISKAITIDGGDGVTIDANDQSRVVYVAEGTEGVVSFKGLTFVGGNATDAGGGLYLGSYASLEDCVVKDNYAGVNGGGIYIYTDFYDTARKTTIVDTLIVDNEAGSYAGGVSVDAVNNIHPKVAYEVSLERVTIAGNSAVEHSGGLFKLAAMVEIADSIIVGNLLTGPNADQISGSGHDIDGMPHARYPMNAENVLSRFETEKWSNADAATNYVYDPSKPLFTDAENGDYSLAVGSQALGLGSNGGNLGSIASSYEAPSLVVTTTDDVVDPEDGEISLREAISYAVAGDTITFATSLYGKTLTLQNGALEINEAITIDGSFGTGGAQITLDANAASRVITVGSADAPVGTVDAPVVLKGLTLTNGKADLGGGLAAWGNVQIENFVVTGNEATEFGGGLYFAGGADLTNVVLTGNSAVKNGGGVYFLNGANTMTNCLVVENEGSVGSTSYYGGGVFAATGTLKVVDATIANNVAGGVGAGVNAPGVVSFENTIIVENTATKAGASEVYIDVYGTNQHVSGTNVLSSFFSNWDVETGDYTVYDVEKPLFTDMENGDYTLVADSQFFGGYRFPAVVSTIVTTEADVVSEYDGKTSLREALANAQPGDVIEFADGVSTIKLNGTEIVVDKAVTFKGDVTIDAQGQSRVFTVAADSGVVNFDGLTFVNGNATAGEYFEAMGGAVYVKSDATFTNVEFRDNIAGNGGAVAVFGGAATFENIVATGNKATSDGSAIAAFFNGSSVAMTNALIAGNEAGYGNSGYGAAALLAYGSGSFTINNSTIADNRVSANDPNGSSYAGAAGVDVRFAAPLTLNNSIVVNNVGADGYVRDVDSNDAGAVLNANNVMSSFTAWTNAATATNFVYDATKPLFADAANGDYTLAENSRAAGMGDNSLVTTTTDLNGDVRVNAVDNLVDLGAFESPYARWTEAKSTVVTTNLDVVDDRDDLISLREALAYAANGAGNTITFDASLDGATILLTQGELVLTNNTTTFRSLKIDASKLENGVTVDAQGQSRVFNAFQTKGMSNFRPTFNNLTITGGYVDGDGAGIYSALSAAYGVTLIDCVVDGNVATGSGAGVYSQGATVSGTTFSGNKAGVDGGGLYFSGSNMSITSSTFDGNEATGSGGGLYVSGSNNTFDALTFTNNVAGANGGGVSFASAGKQKAMTNLTLDGNVATGFGGGIYFAGANTTFENLTLTGNKANAGAGMYATSSVNLTNATITGNEATGEGGGIRLNGGVVVNALIADNVAGTEGGGVRLYGSGSKWYNVTIAGNTAADGAGIFSQSYNAYYNSIILGNLDTTGAANDLEHKVINLADGNVSSSRSAGYNVLSSHDNWDDAPIISGWGPSNAILYVAADGVSDYSDVFADPANGDYTLAVYSPAINAGNDANVSTTTDMAGADRKVGAVDLGAFEAQGIYTLNAPVVSATATGDTTITLVIESVPGASGYVYEYSTSADFANATTVAADAAGEFAISGLNAYATYYFRAKAVGTLPYADSAYAEATVKTNEAPSTVVTTNLDVVDPTDGLYSLREAIAYAASGATITFADGLETATITLTQGELTINKSLTIDGDVTVDAAGASRVLRLASGNVALKNLTITGGKTDGLGGGVYNEGATLTVDGVTFDGNEAKSGGAIYNAKNKLTITDSTFTNNKAIAATIDSKGTGANEILGGGAGVYHAATASISVSGSTFSGNEATNNGAGLYISRNSLSSRVVLNSTFTDNKAGVDGGAIWAGREVVLTNLLIADNTAGYLGSAVVVRENGSATMTNCTVVNNVSLYNEGRAGAAYYGQTSQSFYNSIFVGNKDANGAASDVICGLGFYADGTPFASGSAKGYNILSEASTNWSSSSQNVIAYDATQPLFTDAANGDYTLVAYSQAINAGNDAYVSTTTDLAGLARKVGAVDLGAFEAQGIYTLNAPVVSATATGDTTITLVIESVPGASGYVYEYSTSADFANATTVAADAAGEITISGLTALATYYFRAKAVGTLPYADSAYSETTAKTYETPSTVVTTVKDVVDPTDGEISLREALAYAENGDAITFVYSKDIRDKTIALKSTLVVDKDVTIDAENLYHFNTNQGKEVRDADATALTISGSAQTTLLSVAQGVSATVVGIRFESGLSSLIGAKSAMIDVDGALTMQDCVVANVAKAQGVLVSGADAKFDAIHVIFEANDVALDVQNGAVATVYDSFFRKNVDAVAVDSAAYYSFGTTYSDNVALRFENGSVASLKNGVVVGAREGIVVNDSTVDVVNMTIADNKVAFDAQDSTLTFYNSILVENDVEIQQAGNVELNAYNLMTSMNTWIFAGWTTAVNPVPYVGNVDALFADFEGRDLTLVAGSAAIDAGNDAYAVGDVDLVGKNRVAGAAIDLGAYESGSTTYFGLEAPTVKLGELDAATKKLPMSWNSVDNATRYRVEASNDGENWFFSEYLEGTERLATISYSNAKYFFRVRAEGTSGAEAENFSDWAYAVYGEAVPTVPGDIEFGAYDSTTGQVKMTWGAADEATNYRVEYAAGDNPSAEDFKFSETTAGDVTERLANVGKNGGSVFTFRVRAENGFGVSDWVYGTYVPAAPTAPTAITFGAYDATTGKVEMSWTAVDNVTRYRVEAAPGRAPSEDAFFFSQYTTAGVTERLANVGLNGGSDFTFRVRAENGAGVSEWVYATYPVHTEAPTGPTSVVFDSFDAATGKLTMSWTGVSATAATLRVEYSVDGGATWAHSQTLKGNATGRVATVGAKATYQFRVCAINTVNADDPESWTWTYSDTFNASQWEAQAVSNAVSDVFAELFAEDSEDDFWFELENALGKRSN